jgi:hypothetical protein
MASGISSALGEGGARKVRIWDSSNQDLSEARHLGGPRAWSVVRGAVPAGHRRGPMPSISQTKPVSHVLGKSQNCPSMTHSAQRRTNRTTETTRWPFSSPSRVTQLTAVPVNSQPKLCSRDAHVLRDCAVSRLDHISTPTRVDLTVRSLVVPASTLGPDATVPPCGDSSPRPLAILSRICRVVMN